MKALCTVYEAWFGAEPPDATGFQPWTLRGAQVQAPLHCTVIEPMSGVYDCMYATSHVPLRASLWFLALSSLAGQKWIDDELSTADELASQPGFEPLL
eukprot:CAMPEP_0183372498 /NCGR_PEP_ID=MMETSP0164_2-20130417/108608_1 /TAXON_ID=221442 /ORGANISM="Coccolithus pelagicus ssp braarudi, Strain PLY182g" /LENGTH=97 /DNA_ID=CAMNT_0025549207 /DNA_START=23 /DNA_END=317 /DNA_ORIENTATION=+